MANELLTKQDQLERFRRLDREASEMLSLSKLTMTKAILDLNAIREEALFLAAEYNTFEEYLHDFTDYNGVSRAMIFNHLATVRLALASGMTENEIIQYGIYTLKPFYETGAGKPIQEYDRWTGEIKKIDDRLNVDSDYGDYVREHISPGDPPAVARAIVRQKMAPARYSFFPVFSGEKVTDVEWYLESGDKTLGHGLMRDMGGDVLKEFVRRLGK